MSFRVHLIGIKTLHTVIWAFFVGCILAIPLQALIGKFDSVLILTAVVMLEIFILGLNSWSCPLTEIAARYTDDRRDNFDIYLPEWLARHNKSIFGPLFIAGLVFSAVLSLISIT